MAGAEKPIAGFVLSLIGGILAIMGSFLAAMFGAICGGITAIVSPGAGAGIALLFALPLIFGILMIVGAVYMYSEEPDRMKKGGIIVLVFSVLSLILGNWLGGLLGIIGGVLGLAGK